MPRPLVLTGKRFGMLSVLNREPSAQGRGRWRCLCDCGVDMVAKAGNLTSGNTKSCGCVRGIKRTSKRTRHGMAGSAEYKAWARIIQRCHNESHPRFSSYGGRGIKVCRRWLTSFTNFMEDMGAKPSPELTLERVHNDKGYSPSNCKWATRLDQANNTSRSKFLTCNGRTLTLAQWARKVGIRPGAIQSRIRRGWSVSRAILTKT